MDLSSQAAQSAQQGQQLLSQDQSNASQYQGDYSNYQGQADVANQNLQSYTNYMQNAGNPLSLYNTGISQAEQSEGFDPTSLATATQNLIKQQNALAAVNSASQSSTGGYGLSGAQLGNYYASQSQPLQGAITAQNNAVGNLQQLYQNALTQGQQGATLGFQGEQQVSGNLNQVYQNAQNQASQALSQMQFYSQLASTQGGLNATNANNYAAAQQAYAQAQQAISQSGLLLSQTTGQNLANQQTQAAIAKAAAAAQAGGAAATSPGITIGNAQPTSGVQIQGTAPKSNTSLQSLMTPSGFSTGAGAFNL